MRSRICARKRSFRGSGLPRVLAIIAAEIARGDGDSVALTYEDFMFEHHCGVPTVALPLLRYLGLIEVSTGKYLAGSYKLSAWRCAVGFRRPVSAPDPSFASRVRAGVDDGIVIPIKGANA
jgi:hypothetical protein